MTVNFIPAHIKKKNPQWREVLCRACNSKVDGEHLDQFKEYSKFTLKWVIRTMKEHRQKATYPERLFAAFLRMHKIKFIPQAPFYIVNDAGKPKIYFADFYLPTENMIVEIDGKDHLEKKHKTSDRKRDAAFLGIGIETCRIPNTLAHRTFTKFDFPFIKPKEESI
jgi:very-short-patch-repair endonuclease